MRRVMSVAAAGAVAALTLIAGPMAAEAATPSTDPRGTVAVKDVALTVGADQSSRNLSWFSTDPTARCVVYTATRGNHRSTTVRAYATGAATDAGYTWFHATLSGLKSSTDYRYRVGDCATHWTADHQLSTQDGGRFSFLLVGDPQLGVASDGTMTGTPGWQNTLTQATKRFPKSDFVVSAGDQVNSYTNTAQSPEWDAFLAPRQLTQLALAPTVGNHDNASGTGTQYAEHLALPNVSTLGAAAPGTGDYWYTYNGALFVDLDTNNLDVAAHEAFIRQAKAANPRATWTVAVFHHALFSSADHPNDADVVQLRAQLAPVLSNLGVDLVLNGHDHDYARSYLMNGSTPVAGTSGSTVKATKGEVLYIATNSASGGKFYALTGPYPWTAVTNQENVPNYTNVVVDRGSITATTYRTTDGSVVDKVTLTRSSHR